MRQSARNERTITIWMENPRGDSNRLVLDLLITNQWIQHDQCIMNSDEGGYDVRNEETEAGYAVQIVHGSDRF